jgi:hypothetical protein
MKTIIALLLSANIAFAQIYDVPFASKGNVVELSVENNSVLTAEGVKVEATKIPEGIKFEATSVAISSLKPKAEQAAMFTFSIEKTTQINKEQTIRFNITDKTGQTWTKEVIIKIGSPMTFELYQNYPNPFNPTTTIEYQLPGTGTRYMVSIRVYDIIGREIMTLVNEQQEPGYYQKTFNASRLASGMYIYQLIATDQHNNKHVFKKKMVLLR